MKISIVPVILLVILFACDRSTKETPSGFKFKVIETGDGILPAPGKIIVFDYSLTDSKDSVWTSTVINGFPSAYMIADSSAMESENGVTQMLRMLSKGDSAMVELSVKDFYKDLSKRPRPSNIDSTLNVRYQFRVKEIMDKDAFMVYEQEMVRQFMERQLGKDTVRIDAYLTEKGIQAAKLESGIRYVITTAGEGEKATSGQTAHVHYAGYLLTGEYFDTSYKSVAEANGLFNPGNPYEPYPVTIDQSNVIQGWHEALKMLSKGSKGTFYIPSTLAYGPRQRDNVIKPNSILVFDIEMVDLK